MSIELNKKIKKVINWINKQGYEFRFSNTTEVDLYSRTVIVFPNTNQEQLLYTLLHECGHIIIGDYDTYQKEFKSLLLAIKDSRHSRSNIYKYKLLKEEIDAWEQGKILAQKLKIRLNKEKYDRYAAKCFMTYVKYLNT